MREFFVRGLSGVIYIALVIIAIFASREWFMGLFLLLSAITLREFLKLIHLKSYLAYVLLATGLYFLSYSIFDINAVYLLLILCCFVNLFLLKDVLWTTKIPMFGKKKYVTVIFYLISGFIFLTLIPYMNEKFAPKVLVGVFLIIWSNDSFAYIVGKSFGKRKLLERISPKKTVEGFIGGILGAILASFIIFKFVVDTYTLINWIIIAILASVFGTIGDLIQSKFKRQAGVKDSGVLMPGHGGLYDRLDSIVYASPFIYAYLEIVNHVT